MQTELAKSPSYLSFKETQDFLNVKESWLRAAVFQKEIPHCKFKRLIRFEINDLLYWIDQNKVDG